jgi:ABC-type transport system involved in multi-copper enzyme maturation permease subunit
MSTVVEQSPTAGRATPVRSSGSLLRAEVHRFRARRFIRVLLSLALLGWLAAVVIGLTQFGNPTEADFADARQRVQQELAVQEGFRQQCLDDPSRPDDVSPEESCGQPLRASDFRVEDFVGKAPFDFAAAGENGALGFGAAAAVLAFLVGATWIGAEWSTRSLVALLFWVPQRMKVMGAKLAVLAAASALLGVAMQAGWLAMAGLLRAVAGSGDALPPGFWGDLLATQGRSVLLAVLAALIGFGLANLTRNTGAALGIGFVYFAILETAVRILRPTWEPWLLSNNAVALVNPGGITVFVPTGEVGPNASGMREYLIGNLQAGLVLGIVTAVVVAVGVVLFARRDLQ